MHQILNSKIQKEQDLIKTSLEEDRELACI